MAVFDGQFPWFAMPNHVTTDGKDNTVPGIWAELSAAEKALYPVLYRLCNTKTHSTEVTNKQLRDLTGLHRKRLAKAIEAIPTRMLFAIRPTDERGEGYEVKALDRDGKPFDGQPVTTAVQLDRAAGRAMRRRKAPATTEPEDTWGRIDG